VIGDRIAGSIAGSSMWQMLIGSLIPEFGCAIIPTAREAFLVPIAPMAREPYKSISPADYADFRMRAASRRPLYGVGVYAVYGSSSVFQSEGDNRNCVGETFVAAVSDADEASNGAWMFVQAPTWMNDWVNFDPGSSALDLLTQPSHDATGIDTSAVTRDITAETPDWNNAMKKYAQWRYSIEALNGRTGTLVGKLRFDICPGTTIRIESEDEFKSEGVDTLAIAMIGLVTRVTVYINAEQAMATTTFELMNLRTVTENESDRFSMTSHPFFNDTYFKGAPLVATLEVPT